MSKQFSLCLTEKDERLLQRHLCEPEGNVFLLEESEDRFPKLVDVPDQGEFDLFSISYLARLRDLKHIRLEKIGTHGIYAVDSLVSPVIEFSSSNIDEGTILPGRMYFTTGFFGRHDEWIDKNPEFVSWADQIFRRAKRSLVRSKAYDTYLGREAASLINENTLSVSTRF